MTDLRARYRLVGAVCLVLFLVACGSRSLVSDVFSAVYSDTFNASNDITQTKLNPDYRYLRVEVAGANAALLVLGYLDATPQGDVEVWYSSKGEVIKLQNGRIVGTAGLTTDWRRVSYPIAPPAWTAIPVDGLQFTRVRDESPGYRNAIAQTVQLKPWAGLPSIPLAATLPTDVARSYDWYQEVQTGSPERALPPSWFAVDYRDGKRTVIYSEQCLSVSLCLKLQLWPVEKAKF